MTTTDPTGDHMRALRVAIRALQKIRDGKEVQRRDGTTEIVDLEPGEAAKCARDALEVITDD